ncbi:MAG: sulfotransferase [Steroidobacteraceae bacterium]
MAMFRRNPDNRFIGPLDRWRAARHARACAADFAQVEVYCQFIGFPYSGHTLIGSLLNSHPDVVIAHEADALARVAAGATRDQLFESLLRAEWHFAAGGFHWWGYDYSVPGQWQGRYRRLRAIGDKKGGRSARRLDQDPGLLERLRERVAVPVRLIINTRNPWDNLARIARRKRLPLDSALEWYASFARGVALAMEQAEPGEVLLFEHEQFIAEPSIWLERMAVHLGLVVEPDWLEAAASRVFASPRQARQELDWEPAMEQRLRELIAGYPFLAGYDR